MKGLKQFGAMALAAAMTITLVAPMSVNAGYGYFADDDQPIYDTDNHGTYTTDEEGEETWKGTSSTYKNRITGDTYSYDYATDTSSGDWEKATTYKQDLLKKMTIGTNDFGYYEIDLAPGSILSGKVKITKGKGNITLKQSSTYEGSARPSKDYTAKRYYFEKQDGSKEYIDLAWDATDAQIEALSRKAYSYSYRIYGKKPGNSEIKFKVTDASGKKKTYKVKITVSNDARAFTSITYAGKALQLDLSKGGSNNSYYSVQSSNKNGNNYVTKKSGKLKCKMGKDYKFIAAYVIKPNGYTTESKSAPDGSWSYTDKAKRITSRGIDLNNDGDCEDTINGISEKGIGFDKDHPDRAAFVDCNYVKVKNGKKIKLNKVASKSDYTYTSKTASDSYSIKSQSAFADTTIIIVYQNKITKEFKARSVTLRLKVAKK